MGTKQTSSSYTRLNTLVREKKSTASREDYDQVKTDKGNLTPAEQYPAVLNEVILDEDLRSFISIITDTLIRGGYTLTGDNKRKVKEAEKVLKELRLRKNIKKIAPNLLIYLHSFVEIDNNPATGKPVKLYVIDTSRVTPKSDLKGRIVGWNWRSPEDEKVRLTWSVDELAHYEMDNFTPTFWGYTNMETLKDIVDLKKKVMKYIAGVFDKNLLKTHFHGKNVPQQDIASWLDMVLTGYVSDDVMVTTGSEDMEGKRYMEESFVLPLIELLNLLRNKMLTLFRVPPIIAGTVDNSNRSNSEIQARFAFMNRIKAIQEEIAEDCEFELFPKLGLEGVAIKFGSIDSTELRNYIDIAVLLMNAGAYKEPILEWLKVKGYELPEELFPSLDEEKQARELESQSNSNQIDPDKNKNEKNSNLSSSRLPQDNFQK